MKERRRLDLPDRRKHTYAQLERRIDDHVELIELRLHRFFKKALFIFAVIGMTSAGSLLGFGIVLSQLKKTRKDFVSETCLAQNKRHDKTVAAFYRESAKLKRKYPSEAGQIDDSVKSNLRLIDALAPKQNCERLSEVSVGEAKPPPPDPSPKKEGP